MQSPPHPDKAQTVMNKIAALLARIILPCFRTKQTHFQYSLAARRVVGAGCDVCPRIGDGDGVARRVIR